MLGNTGQIVKNKIKADRRLIIVSMRDSAGALTSIPKASLNEAYLISKINAANAKDRFYFLPIHENPEATREANTVEVLNFGTSFFIKKGLITFKNVIPLASQQLTGAIDEFRGENIGFYFIDDDSNFCYVADPDDDTIMLPLPINSQNFSAVAQMAGNATTAKCAVEFQLARSFTDKLLRCIEAENLDFNGLDETVFNGLLDLSLTTTSTTTKLTATVKIKDYDLPATGFVITDFALANITSTPAPIVITGCTEVSDGVYELTFTAQTAADVIRTTITKQKYGTVIATATVA